MTAPPMPYSGGKQRIAAALAAMMPPHDTYIEPFAGALSVLLAKTPAPIEVVNDIDQRIVAFWRVLRDRPDDLARVCALTPHSRSELLAARENLDHDDELERARCVWVALTQSRGSNTVRSGWRFVHGGNRLALAKYFEGYLARFPPAAVRLREVSLECRPALDVIAAYGRQGALLYVDPPYLGETRHGSQYAHEMLGRSEHERLLGALLDTPALVMLSGYASDLYDARLSDWWRTELHGSAMTGDLRTEIVWTNFPPTNEQLTLGESE